MSNTICLTVGYLHNILRSLRTRLVRTKNSGSGSSLSPHNAKANSLDLFFPSGPTTLQTAVDNFESKTSDTWVDSHPYSPPEYADAKIKRILCNVPWDSHAILETVLMAFVMRSVSVLPRAPPTRLRWAPKSLKWFLTLIWAPILSQVCSLNHVRKFLSVEQVKLLEGASLAPRSSTYSWVLSKPSTQVAKWLLSLPTVESMISSARTLGCSPILLHMTTHGNMSKAMNIIEKGQPCGILQRFL